MKALLRELLKEVREGERTEPLGAAPRQRTESRQGYRPGDSSRGLVTRIGKRKLRVPRDRNGEFSTALFERSQRSEKALVGALASDVRPQGSAFDRGEALNRRRGTFQRTSNTMTRPRRWEKAVGDQEMRAR